MIVFLLYGRVTKRLFLRVKKIDKMDKADMTPWPAMLRIRAIDTVI
jgi:hypothetical protein